MTSDQLINKLPLVDENIVAEAASQPLLFVDASRYRVARMRKKHEAEAALEAFEVQLGLAVRDKKSQAGERVTEKYIKSRVQKNPKYAQLRASVSRCEEREEFSKLLLEAFRMRRDAIRVIADAQGYEGARRSGEAERIETHLRLNKEARRLHERNRRLRE